MLQKMDINNLTQKINGKILPETNRDLSEKEFLLAGEICDRIRGLVGQRDEYIKENHLDPLFCYGDANWSIHAANDYLETFKQVAQCRYEVINRLRWFTQFFTGYSLRHAKDAHGLPSFEPLTRDSDSQITAAMKEPDFWVHRWLTLVLNIPYDYVYSPPRLLGEVGWNISEVVVNHDTCVYQERVSLLYEAGIYDWLRKQLSRKGCIRILEVGGGYGALAYKIKLLFPHCSYWICDLPESLLYSALYLSINRPDVKHGFAEESPGGFTYLPNYMLNRLEGNFDLVINTLSFSEMSQLQLRFYLQKIKDVNQSVILFEQNQDNRHAGFIDTHETISDYFEYFKPLKLSCGGDLTEGSAHAWSNDSQVLNIGLIG